MAYQSFAGLSARGILKELQHKRNNWVPIKLCILRWRINLLSLPTRERLSARGILIDSILCPVCGIGVETIDHIFAGCSQLKEVWCRIAIWWGVDTPQEWSVQSIFEWPEVLRAKDGQRKAFEAVLLTTFWVLWNFRNASVFDPSPPKKASILDDVVDRSFFWVSNRCKNRRINWGMWLQNPLIACNTL